MEALGISLRNSPDYIITVIMSEISDQPVNEYNNDELTHQSTDKDFYCKCPFIPNSQKMTSVFETHGLFFISSLK